MLNIHSLESFGTHEGPGIRFVIFLQGCMFRCIYCHNPDTIDLKGGHQITDNEIIKRILDEKVYFGKKGGITISGGEPMLQAKNIIPLFRKLKEHGINTTIDTNGYPRNQDVEELTKLTDLFLLDIKQMNNKRHKKITGQSNEHTLKFMDYLKERNKKIRLRYVLVPGYTDQEEYLHELGEKYKEYPNIERVEILPYHTLGEYKRKELGRKYELEGVKAPTKEKIDRAKGILEEHFTNVFIR